MDKKDILVSICCITYNHEKFIRQALEGFVTQKTNFRYEVLVHDDASVDKTAQIIKEYEEKFPDIIKPIYQKENQYRNGGRIVARFVFPKAQGKYIAFCEGDDFWTDSNKLQMQIDALEANPDCSICLNKVELTDIEGKKKGIFLPFQSRVQSGVIQSVDYLSFVAYPGAFQCMAFQLSGCIVRSNFLNEFFYNEPLFRRAFDVGDIPLFLYMGMKGNAYYIDQCMSCYRTENANSWAGRMGKASDKGVGHYEIECQGLEAFDVYSDYIVHKDIEKGVQNRKFIILRIRHDIHGLKADEMKELYSLLPLRSRIIEHVFHFFPWGEAIWVRVKKLGIQKILDRKFAKCSGSSK